MKTLERFRATHEQEAGAWRRKRVIRCGECGHEATCPENTGANMPVDLVARKFRERGWHVGSRATQDLCPRCQRKPDAVASVDRSGIRSAAAQLAAFQRQRTLEATMTPVVAPPKQPTREERRRVQDALDEHYDVGQQRYIKAFSDKALAEKLDVPRAWVSEERDRAYGPDRNEVQGEQAAKADALEARAKALEEQGLQLASEAEALKRDVAALRTQLSYPSAA